MTPDLSWIFVYIRNVSRARLDYRPWHAAGCSGGRWLSHFTGPLELACAELDGGKGCLWGMVHIDVGSKALWNSGIGSTCCWYGQRHRSLQAILVSVTLSLLKHNWRCVIRTVPWRDVWCRMLLVFRIIQYSAILRSMADLVMQPAEFSCASTPKQPGQIGDINHLSKWKRTWTCTRAFPQERVSKAASGQNPSCWTTRSEKLLYLSTAVAPGHICGFPPWALLT